MGNSLNGQSKPMHRNFIAQGLNDLKLVFSFGRDMSATCVIEKFRDVATKILRQKNGAL